MGLDGVGEPVELGVERARLAARRAAPRRAPAARTGRAGRRRARARPRSRARPGSAAATGPDRLRRPVPDLVPGDLAARELAPRGLQLGEPRARPAAALLAGERLSSAAVGRGRGPRRRLRRGPRSPRRAAGGRRRCRAPARPREPAPRWRRRGRSAAARRGRRRRASSRAGRRGRRPRDRVRCAPRRRRRPARAASARRGSTRSDSARRPPPVSASRTGAAWPRRPRREARARAAAATPRTGTPVSSSSRSGPGGSSEASPRNLFRTNPRTSARLGRLEQRPGPVEVRERAAAVDVGNEETARLGEPRYAHVGEVRAQRG